MLKDCIWSKRYRPRVGVGAVEKDFVFPSGEDPPCQVPSGFGAIFDKVRSKFTEPKAEEMFIQEMFIKKRCPYRRND
jgi:hypothetical protein